MPEKKTVPKKKLVSQLPPAVSPPALVSTLKTAAASSPPPPVSEESPAKLIALATSSPDSPLGLVWKHAFQEGSKGGFRRGTELFKGKDVKQAFREGADEGQIVGILSERREWETAGHGPWCFDTKTNCFSCDTGLTDGHTCTANKLNTMVQASPSHHTSSSQTSPPPLLVNAEAQAQLTDSTLTTTVSTLDPPAFDWSDNAASIPIVPTFPKNQPRRDLSALHSTNPNPFSSLAHQNQHHLPLENRTISQPTQPFWPHQTPPFFPISQPIPHRHFIQVPNPPAPLLPPTSLNVPMAFDWESDPCLSDLSQVLKALGWVHQ